MFRPISRTFLALVLIAGAAVGSARAQEGGSGDDGAAALEGYLEELRLDTLLAEHLRARLDATPREARRELAERLGRVYARLLADAGSSEERGRWTERGRELLNLVPEADSFDLRLDLAKAVYNGAEEALERYRLRLGDEAARADAEATLRSIEPAFRDVARSVHRRVEAGERVEDAGQESPELSARIEADRRLRSIAYYYLGWTQYYLAFATGQEQHAINSLQSFGWLLNSRGGNAATVDRLPTGLLRYEHIARAALGCALCEAVRNNGGDAAAWLQAVAAADGLPKSVREQLLAREITVYAQTRRWADLERVVRTARAPVPGGSTAPLPTVPARLLAIVALEADSRLGREATERLAQIAIGDLVARGEASQVLDLVKRYGTSPIGSEGFIVNFVRGLLAYEQAREAHAAASDPEKPATDTAVLEKYRTAQSMLSASLTQPDAAEFKAEGARAAITLGMAFSYCGQYQRAADSFMQARVLAGESETAEEALWLAVVALNSAADAGDAEAKRRLLEAATLFLQSHPGGERAARLLLQRSTAALLSPEKAAEILLGVSESSPMFESSRRQAARLLYQVYRSSRADRRDFAAIQFANVAERVLAIDHRLAIEGSAEQAEEASPRVVLLCRQLLDAILGATAPDPDRAEAVLSRLRQVEAHNRLNLSGIDAELSFRRLQIALARDDDAAAAAEAGKLGSLAGPYGDAADRLLFRRAADRWRESGDLDAARRLVMFGDRIAARLSAARGEAPPDDTLIGVWSVVAEAAFALWQSGDESEMRDAALRADTLVLGARPASEASLRRVAAVAESAGDNARALDCWRTLLAGYAEGGPKWFEARYESVRLLGLIDPARGRAVLDQHKALYPQLGPPPWDERLRALDRTLPAPPPPTPTGGPGG